MRRMYDSTCPRSLAGYRDIAAGNTHRGNTRTVRRTKPCQAVRRMKPCRVSLGLDDLEVDQLESVGTSRSGLQGDLDSDGDVDFQRLHHICEQFRQDGIGSRMANNDSRPRRRLLSLPSEPFGASTITERLASIASESDV